MLHVRRNRRVRDFEDLRHAAVVQLDLENLRVGIALRKSENVLEVRAPPGVDRLGIISHHHHVAMLSRERVDEIGLDFVRVLIFIDEDELELSSIKRGDFVMFDQHLQRLLQQIVEIHRVCRFFLPFVARLHISNLIEQR